MAFLNCYLLSAFFCPQAFLVSSENYGAFLHSPRERDFDGSCRAVGFQCNARCAHRRYVGKRLRAASELSTILYRIYLCDSKWVYTLFSDAGAEALSSEAGIGNSWYFKVAAWHHICRLSDIHRQRVLFDP